MPTLNTLTAANKLRQAEWDPANLLSLSFSGNELAGEIGEACNIIKKLDREMLGLPGSRSSVADLATELADGIICISIIASKLGIDLDQAVIDKFNATSRKVGLGVFL